MMDYVKKSILPKFKKQHKPIRPMTNDPVKLIFELTEACAKSHFNTLDTVSFALNFYLKCIVGCTLIGTLYGCHESYEDKKVNIKNICIDSFNGLSFGIAIPALPFMVPAALAYKLNRYRTTE